MGQTADLLGTDPGSTPMTVRHNPVSGDTNCHAMQVTQAATSGNGAAISVVSNSTAAAIQVRGNGDLLDLRDSDGETVFNVSQTGELTASGLALLNGILNGDITIVDGQLVVDSSGTAINAVDRGSTSNYAAYALRTAGVDRWAWQMQPGSQDLYLVDSANGLTVMRVRPGASAPNVSLLDGGVDFGGGTGVVHLANATTAPSTNPASGAVAYVDTGVLKTRSSTGAIASLLPVGTTAGTVAAGDDARFSSSQPWVFDVTATTYGALGDARVVGDGAMSSGSATLTSATAAFVAGDVGKSVSVKGAAATGVTTLVTTIQTVNSSTNVTLAASNASGGALSNAVVIVGTDDTAAIQAAVTAAEAYLAAGHTYAQVYFPPRAFVVAGALSTAGSGNGQIVFGVYTTSAVKKILEFRGETHGAAAVRHWEQVVPQFSGSCLLSLKVYSSTSAQITDLNANGNPGVISGPNEGTSNGLAYGASARYSNVMAVLTDLTILTTHSAYGLTIGAANFYGCANAHIENFAYGTAGTVASPSTDYTSPGTFGTGLSVGLLLPAPGNNDNSIAKNVSCGGGYTYALFLTEHTVMDRYMALYCWAGLCAVGSYAGSVGSVHAMKVLSASIEACTHELYIVGVGSSGVGPIIDIDQLSTESSTPNIGGNSSAAMAGALGTVKLTGLFTRSGVSISDPTGIELVDGSQARAIVKKTSSFTASPIDRSFICDTTSGAITASLPSAIVNPVEYSFRNTGASNLVIDPSGSQTINGAATITLTLGQTARIQAGYDGSAWGWYSV